MIKDIYIEYKWGIKYFMLKKIHKKIMFHKNKSITRTRDNSPFDISSERHPQWGSAGNLGNMQKLGGHPLPCRDQAVCDDAHLIPALPFRSFRYGFPLSHPSLISLKRPVSHFQFFFLYFRTSISLLFLYDFFHFSHAILCS